MNKFHFDVIRNNQELGMPSLIDLNTTTQQPASIPPLEHWNCLTSEWTGTRQQLQHSCSTTARYPTHYNVRTLSPPPNEHTVASGYDVVPTPMQPWG